MKHNTSHESAVLNFTVVAALMGLGFATAIGATAYVPQKSVSQGTRSSYEYEGYVPVEHTLVSGEVVHLSTDVGFVDDHLEQLGDESAQAISRDEQFRLHGQHMEEVLRLGDYEAWTAFMEGHARIGEVVLEDAFTRFVESREAKWRG
jgi:hypothetical protein